MDNKKGKQGRKYLIIGGKIGCHHISPQRLMKLYNVSPEESILCYDENDNNLRGIRQEDYIILRPQWSGDYSLPGIAQKRQ